MGVQNWIISWRTELCERQRRVVLSKIGLAICLMGVVYASTTYDALAQISKIPNIPGAPSAINSPSSTSSPKKSLVYPHGSEAIADVRAMYDGVLPTSLAVQTFRNIDRLFPSSRIPASPKPIKLPYDAQPLTQIQFMDRGRRVDLAQFLELNKVAGLLILKDGKIKTELYRYGNSDKTRWMSMSIAKSVSSTLVGVALAQGKIASLNDPVSRYVPELTSGAYRDVSVRDVLTMSSGVRWNEAYSDPKSDRRHLLELQIAQKPGAALHWLSSLKPQAKPGTQFNYNTGETQIVAYLLARATGSTLADYLSAHIWTPFGMEAEATWWLDAPQGVEIGGSGLSATLRDYGRFGLLMLSGGRVGKRAILPTAWTYEATTPKTLKNGELIPYGYLWWPLTTPQALKDGAYTAIGIHGQYLYINPRQNVVIVIWGAQSQPSGGAVIDVQAFFSAVVQYVSGD